MRHLLFLTLVSLIFLISCERDEITTDTSSKLSFSRDTLSFDTVFTTLGSATKRFMIYNKNDKPLNIASINLTGGSNSPFKLNVDGVSGNKVSDIRIEANDSTYVFVQVNIDPSNQSSPLLIEDAIEIACNENQYKINLRAYGQDVHLIKTDTITSNTTWYNDKPYLILGDLYVDTSITLTIYEGTTIFLHRKSWIIVDGTIIVNGTKERPVVFRGDRLDKANYAPPVPYDKIPGQWGEIWLRNKSTGNKFTYAFVRNAEFGLIVGALKDPEKTADNDQADVELNNCRFENFSACALYGNNGKIKAVNSVFANSGYFNFATSTGGSYEFYHCTFANYPAMGIKDGFGINLRNYVEVPDDSIRDKKNTYAGDLEKAYFGNCVIFGEIEDQLAPLANFVPLKDFKFEYMFDHCLIRGNTDNLEISNTKHFLKSKISKNNASVFVKVDKENYVYDWNLAAKSLARDMGEVSIAFDYPYDYNNNIRGSSDDDAPDAGAFEFVATE